MRSRLYSPGFTLLELSLVLILASILVVVAIPFYRTQILGVGRMQAVAALMNVRQRQQEYFAQHRRYAPSLQALGYPGGLIAIDRQGQIIAAEEVARIYLIELVTQESDYIVTAQPQLAQRRDQRCGSLSLSALGMARVTGADAIPACWRVAR